MKTNKKKEKGSGKKPTKNMREWKLGQEAAYRIVREVVKQSPSFYERGPIEWKWGYTQKNKTYVEKNGVNFAIKWGIFHYDGYGEIRKVPPPTHYPWDQDKEEVTNGILKRNETKNHRPWPFGKKTYVVGKSTDDGPVYWIGDDFEDRLPC
ncbi:hypothetical protein BDP27DRAFT_726207 [Rhodocollybia butyracea]|uniref:Uncharacterized protein n=1 Tax=Rhodocollybia butyracea TaxID=206335 RepID=A0A9P5U8X5_9AGAR|nr:hypothetical protein BDP27DRAFT_726207 [Rhodocollybia butyracea]